MDKLPFIKCFYKSRDTTNDPPNDQMDTIPCTIKEPPHPCDPPLACDPYEEQSGICPEPYLCLERVKNPPYFGELTRCKPGHSIPAKACDLPEPPHPCDDLPPCSSWTDEMKAKKPACTDPALCEERIKNPVKRKKPLMCDPTK